MRRLIDAKRLDNNIGQSIREWTFAVARKSTLSQYRLSDLRLPETPLTDDNIDELYEKSWGHYLSHTRPPFQTGYVEDMEPYQNFKEQHPLLYRQTRDFVALVLETIRSSKSITEENKNEKMSASEDRLDAVYRTIANVYLGYDTTRWDMGRLEDEYGTSRGSPEDILARAVPELATEAILENEIMGDDWVTEGAPRNMEVVFLLLFGLERFAISQAQAYPSKIARESEVWEEV